MLEKLGCTVDIAVNGEETVELWQRHHYDLIFMDCHMPVMDGYEATQMIRQMESEDEHIVIVALTANAMEGERQVCLNAGMDDFVAKPVTISHLEDAIKRQSFDRAEMSI
jgi:CheY-like chemotaxis protein